jgi:hypothetical protein
MDNEVIDDLTVVIGLFAIAAGRRLERRLQKAENMKGAAT